MTELIERVLKEDGDPDAPGGPKEPVDPGALLSEEAAGEPVPVFGTWARWYAVVLGTLGTLILLFYWFTKAWS